MSEHEEALLEKMIFNPVPDDYAALLMREDQGDAPSDSPAAEAAASPRSDAQDKLLDAFLATDHAFTVDEPEEAATDRSRPEPQPSKTADQPRIATPSVPVASPAPSSSLSESGPNLHQKGRYDKAYDIIHALSLNNPKKCLLCRPIALSAKKLMLNQRYATARREGQSNRNHYILSYVYPSYCSYSHRSSADDRRSAHPGSRRAAASRRRLPAQTRSWVCAAPTASSRR